MEKYTQQVIEQFCRIISGDKIKELINSQCGEDLILSVIGKYGQLTPSAICEICHTSSAHTAKTLSQLKQKGMIKREINEEDRRKATVFLTEKGIKRADEVMQSRLEAVSSLLQRLDENEQKELLRLFSKISSDEVNR
ncbi:MAG: winged helix DNA-binding protein [Erysipelotrichaceae bacterium]|nr:winged helix DNA-binding protein [Erysipelotrichaceae bacterium]